MRKPAFWNRLTLGRLSVALLLMLGTAWPLLLAFELGAHALPALALGAGLIVLLAVLSVNQKSRRILWALLALFVGVQFFLPGLGFWGLCGEAFKALALYFNDLHFALPLYGLQVAVLLAVLSAVLSFLFSRMGVGFLPAALTVVLVMFGLWSLQKGELIWYVAPALVALLLLLSQSANEKINLFNVLPMALIAVVLAFLLLPAGRVTIEPLANAASDLKQKIEDYLFFTEPRNVFTLGSYGYYPMGGNQLGGDAEPSEYPVMMVKTDRKTLLRAVAKDEYTGRSFRDTSSAKRYLYVNPRWAAQRRKVFLENMPAESIRRMSALLDEKAISIQVQNSAASTVFTPLFLRSLTTQGDMVPYFNDSSELFITRDLASGDKYTVFAPIFEGGDANLDVLVNASLKTDANYTGIYSEYTQLPDHLEQKVFEDVRSIVANANTPYDKAMAIMRHLQRYYRYTLTPGEPPGNQDFVTYFLYKSKEGYCTSFAAAMTVMCRMASLPARYVEGFLATPASDGFAYVTGKNAHAWTEVYFEGFGWIPFDPTPAQQSGDDVPPQQNTNPEPSPSPSPEPDEQPTPTPAPNQPDDNPTPEPNPNDESEPQQDQPTDDSTDNENNILQWWWLLLIAALLGALAARIALRLPERKASRQATEPDKIFCYGAAVRKLLALRKHEPQKGETPLRFARRVDALKLSPVPISPLWRMMALSNYSRMKPGKEQTARAKSTYRQLYQAQPFMRKLRFLLAVAFDRKLYGALDTTVKHEKPTSQLRLPPSATKRATDNRAFMPSGKPSQSKRQAKSDGDVTTGKRAKPHSAPPVNDRRAYEDENGDETPRVDEQVDYNANGSDAFLSDSPQQERAPEDTERAAATGRRSRRSSANRNPPDQP